MGTRIIDGGAEKVYAAAEEWVERALRADDSLFTPGKAIWSSRWLGELHERFLNNPDESGDGFLEKLQRQLADSPPEVYQLMGETLYFYFLIVSTKNSSYEQRTINTVLGWSPMPAAIPPDFVDGLTPGIVKPGQFFDSRRPYHVGFLVEFVEQWKKIAAHVRNGLLDDAWAFKDFLYEIELGSPLFVNHQSASHAQREAVLHLVFPDTFEPIVSVGHKGKIAKTFANLVTQPTGDVDRQLAQIRARILAQYGNSDSNFYNPEIRVQWDDKYKRGPARTRSSTRM